MLPERYVPRQVSKISAADRRVSITGRVAEASEGSFVIDDDSGKIEIFTEGVSADKGSVVNAFCTLSDNKLNLDALERLGDVDLNLLKTVDELYSKAGV